MGRPEQANNRAVELRMEMLWWSVGSAVHVTRTNACFKKSLGRYEAELR